MTKSPFEKFWAKWDSRVYWTSKGRNEEEKFNVCAFHQNDYEQFKEEFFALCEKQAKKENDIHLKEKNHTCEDYICGCIGAATAFRLVRGEKEK